MKKSGTDASLFRFFSYQDHFRREAWTASLMTL